MLQSVDSKQVTRCVEALGALEAQDSHKDSGIGRGKQYGVRVLNTKEESLKSVSVNSNYRTIENGVLRPY